MSSAIPFAPHFHDERAACAFVEAHLWPDGRVCPHCGGVDRSGKLSGKSTRPGLYKCYECRKPFTVKLGTLFESSNVKLHLWLRAIYLICSSKNRVSSSHLHEHLGVTVKTAWSMRHRISEAMRFGALPAPLVAVFADSRRHLPRNHRPMMEPATNRQSWSNAWNMAVPHDRFTPVPSPAKPQNRAWRADLGVGETE